MDCYYTYIDDGTYHCDSGDGGRTVWDGTYHCDSGGRMVWDGTYHCDSGGTDGMRRHVSLWLRGWGRTVWDGTYHCDSGGGDGRYETARITVTPGVGDGRYETARITVTPGVRADGMRRHVSLWLRGWGTVWDGTYHCDSGGWGGRYETLEFTTWLYRLGQHNR